MDSTQNSIQGTYTYIYSVALSMVMINRHRKSEFLNDKATELSLLLTYGSIGPATKGWGSQDRLRNFVLERFVNKERMR